MKNSASQFGKDLGLMSEVVVTGRKAGFNEKDWGKLAHDEDVMTEVLSVVRGHAAIQQKERVLNSSGHAIIVDYHGYADGELKIVEHKLGEGWSQLIVRKGVDLFINNRKVILFRSPQQAAGKKIPGNELCDMIPYQRLLNATTLDVLLDNTALIPPDWKKKAVFFPNTVYEDKKGKAFVPLLSKPFSWTKNIFPKNIPWFPDGYLAVLEP